MATISVPSWKCRYTQHYLVSRLSVVSLVCVMVYLHTVVMVQSGLSGLCSGLALRLFFCSSCFSLNIPEMFPLCALKSSLSRQILTMHLKIKLTVQVSLCL